MENENATAQILDAATVKKVVIGALALIVVMNLTQGSDPGLGDWLNVFIGLALLAGAIYFIIIKR